MAITTSTLTELYTFKPAYKNLYEITLQGGDNQETSNNYMKFHAFSVSFGGESLGLNRNAITKRFQLNDTDAFKRSDTLTIQWREDEDYSVKRYHENWVKQFYDKEQDCYISCDKDKTNNLYRTVIITLPKSGMIDDKEDNNLKIKFTGVLPQDIPGLTLAWSTQGDIVTHSINYYVTEWSWVE